LADRAGAAGQALRVVNDEWGTPTYAVDLAEAIVELLAADAVGGVHHIVNGSVASRADWARDVVGRAGLDVDLVDVPMASWVRPSRPPRWGVLAPTPLPSGEPLRPWRDAMADYAPALLRASGARAPRRARA
jgi:dTDP-4-dehydrorhamnose reductase